MDSNEEKMMRTLFPDWTKNKRAGRLYACKCLGHRLRKFGFESHINVLSPRELVALSQYVCPAQTAAILSEAKARAETEGDNDLLRILA